MYNKNANALRMLGIDAVERANSGHPGAVMGMADIATVLWKNFVRHDPKSPGLPIRDRVILSNGHASMLLYGALHLLGYAHFTLETLKNFRQLGSIATGHPEYDICAGVEYTTGPLGQGLAGAVGMALGEELCRNRYNKEGLTLFDNYTYVFVGDGCLMEGISHEVCSFAGTMGLDRLIVLYDSNGISIDGSVKPWFSENTAMRFKGYGWNVIEGVDGHDADSIYESINNARNNRHSPTLICYNTVIGYGSPNKAGTAKVHGSPLGQEEVTRVREAYNWNYDEFVIPQDAYEYWNAEEKGAEYTKQYAMVCKKYEQQYPKEWKELSNRREGIIPEEVSKAIAKAKASAQIITKAQATRVSSNEVLENIVPVMPASIGGSADLTPSVGTFTKASKYITKEEKTGNYISYGVREFGMYAIMNGISLYEGFIPYGGTFLVFLDYAKPALRLSAMMKTHVVWILTHDTIGVGEDGPTHQPIEQLTMLRTIPNVQVWRPCDALETAYSWEYAITHKEGPVVLVLSRQNLPQMIRKGEDTNDIAKGGYILCEEENPEIVLLATGSEVQLAVGARDILVKEGVKVRVVSMPSTTVFDMQEEMYKTRVLPEGIPIVAIEAGERTFWNKYVSKKGCIIGMQGYGACGKGEDLFRHFEFTVEHVLSCVHSVLKAK